MLEEQVGMWAAHCVHLGLCLLPAERRSDAVFDICVPVGHRDGFIITPVHVPGFKEPHRPVIVVGL